MRMHSVSEYCKLNALSNVKKVELTICIIKQSVCKLDCSLNVCVRHAFTSIYSEL